MLSLSLDALSRVNTRAPDPDCLDVEYVALKGNYAECCSNGNYKKQEGRKEVCQEARKRRRQENL